MADILLLSASYELLAIITRKRALALILKGRVKGNRTSHEANMKLNWEPKTPRVSYLVAMGEAPAAWKIYLELA